MKYDEFKIWLAEQGASSETARAHRAQALRTIEAKLVDLGFGYTDLDAAWEDDKLASVRSRLSYMAQDFADGGVDFRILMPKAEKPKNRLRSWRAWVGRYSQFRSGEIGGDSDADRIRQHVLEAYIEPARESDLDEVDVFVKQIHDELGLNRSWANVCQVLSGRKFLEMADVSKPKRIGPSESSTTRFSYDLLRLSAASVEVQNEMATTPMPMPTNLILYGPPGTGKTYASAREAVALCDGSARADYLAESREALMTRYRQLQADGRVAFVTFHQSYDYESFVEGLRPETGEADGSAGFRLEVNKGIFRDISALAEQARTHPPSVPKASQLDLTGRQFWKMGLGLKGSEDEVYDSALAGNYIALGWGGSEDWSNPQFASVKSMEAQWRSGGKEGNEPSNWVQPHKFRNEMRKGDIVIVPSGNSAFRAVAMVDGDYEFDSSANGYFAHRRKVRWLLVLEEPLPLETIVNVRFTQRTLYNLPANRILFASLTRLLAGGKQVEAEGQAVNASPQQFVLIIDEINRANVSKVFGELITLIEPDKRIGMPNELKLILPYSREKFGIPANLHIVATMNTADRSIALLDTALRRRFTFKELPPRPDLLKIVAGIDLQRLLRTINDRIEYLIDREHRIGHAFFMGCNDLTGIDSVMREKVIPLLQEYFFDDWNKVAVVLGKGFVGCRKIRPPAGSDGQDRESWSVKETFDEGAYLKLCADNSAGESDPEQIQPAASATPINYS